MAEEFTSLLGKRLINACGEEVNIEDVVGEGKTVGLYFSAHWCPPCRGFTPKLAEFYKAHHLDKKFEIVFVSSDKNEEGFKEYYSEMPWLALPFSERALKEKLSKKFSICGIPTLILLDGKDGKVVTKDGRSMVQEDKNGKNFPWRPKGVRELIQDELFNNKKEKKELKDLAGKVLGLYFSAHWCPPCRTFTPKLIETYNKLVGSEKPFEIVFVSSDRSEDGYTDYFKDMPWLALPYGDERVKPLSRLFGVEGIPTLILLDENLKVISTNGRALIGGDPEGKEFPWLPKPLSVLDELTVSTVNDGACLIYFTDGEDTSIKTAQEILQPVAELFFKEDPPVRFFYTKGDDIADSLRDFAQLTDDDDDDDNGDNILAILDIPSQKVFVSESQVLTREAVTKFVKDYQDCALEPKILRG